MSRQVIRPVVVATFLLLSGVLLVFAGSSWGSGTPADPFIVHEWGTFTSLQGSDGVSLEGLEREEEALPSFVYDRTQIRECPLRKVGYKGLEQPIAGVTQKMETPVIYFHSNTARRVRVHVDFEKGLLSQWYPVSDLLGPPEGELGSAPLDLAKLERSFLEWEVDVLPKGSAPPAEVPAVEAKDDPWLFAREVDACWVRTTPRVAPERRGPVEAERYLFYRGLGRFELPLSIVAEENGRGVLRNAGGHALGTTFLLEVRGERGRIQILEAVPAQGEIAFAHGDKKYWGPLSDIVAKLSAILGDVLVEQGLHADEARAMVRTWSRSWFTDEGTRVLYVVPRPLVDAMLPLRIEPAPDQLVRVLLGRLEYITPETEAEVEQALIARASGDIDARRTGEERLARLGRFLEPHLRRVLARTKDAAARAGAEELLAAAGKELEIAAPR